MLVAQSVVVDEHKSAALEHGGGFADYASFRQQFHNKINVVIISLRFQPIPPIKPTVSFRTAYLPSIYPK